MFISTLGLRPKVCIQGVHRFLVQMAGLCALVSCHLITCTAHLSIELWKMRYINDSK